MASGGAGTGVPAGTVMELAGPLEGSIAAAFAVTPAVVLDPEAFGKTLPRNLQQHIVTALKGQQDTSSASRKTAHKALMKLVFDDPQKYKIWIIQFLNGLVISHPNIA